MHIKRVYSSLNEALKQIETKEYNPLVKDKQLRSSYTGNFSFCETHSLEEAINLGKTGWKKGRDVIAKLTKEHEDAFTKLFPRQDFEIQLKSAEAGEIVNVDAAIQGLPESMFHFDQDEEKMRKLSQGKMQRILISGEIPFYINTDTIFNRGAIISSMVNIMELYGFRTELWLCHVRQGYSKDNTVKYFYRIKRFDGDLDLGLLAFITAHPSMIRRINFALLEQEIEPEVFHEYVNSSYGRCTDLSDDEIFHFQGELSYGNIYFEMLHDNKTFSQLLNDTKVKIQNHFTKIKI